MTVSLAAACLQHQVQGALMTALSTEHFVVQAWKLRCSSWRCASQRAGWTLPEHTNLIGNLLRWRCLICHRPTTAGRCYFGRRSPCCRWALCWNHPVVKFEIQHRSRQNNTHQRRRNPSQYWPVGLQKGMCRPAMLNTEDKERQKEQLFWQPWVGEPAGMSMSVSQPMCQPRRFCVPWMR